MPAMHLTQRAEKRHNQGLFKRALGSLAAETALIFAALGPILRA
jgi:hypothetical protein